MKSVLMLMRERYGFKTFTWNTLLH